MTKLEELQKKTKSELAFYINFNISPFIDTKKKTKQELINIILMLKGE